MAILTVKNRYPNEPFIGVFDGQTYEVADTLAVPDYVAHHLKNQSIIRDNPVNAGANEYRLAILESGDDASLLTELPQESMDRTDLEEFRKVRIVPSGIRINAPAPRSPAYGDTVRATAS